MSKISPGTFGIYALIAIGGVLMIVPLYFMVIFATQSRATIFSFPPPLLPGSFEQIVSNYNALMEMSKGLFWRVFWNSFYLAGVATVTTVFFSSLAGYGFAMYEFRGKSWLFNIVIATQAIPSSLNLIPFYLVMNLIGWINQPKALWFPGIASAFGIFLTRQYIQSAIPRELLDAARVDGCTEFGIFWRIVLPLIRPALGTLGLIGLAALAYSEIRKRSNWHSAKGGQALRCAIESTRNNVARWCQNWNPGPTHSKPIAICADIKKRAFKPIESFIKGSKIETAVFDGNKKRLIKGSAADDGQIQFDLDRKRDVSIEPVEKVQLFLTQEGWIASRGKRHCQRWNCWCSAP